MIEYVIERKADANQWLIYAQWRNPDGQTFTYPGPKRDGTKQAPEPIGYFPSRDKARKAIAEVLR